MLTPEQIEAARKMVLCLKTGSEDEAAEALAEDDDYLDERTANARESLEDAAVLGNALAALSAYSRVVAWMDGVALSAVINSHHLPAEVRDAVRGCRDDVRGALDGE